MNTIKKGNEFEDEVFKFIQDYINSGNTWLNPNYCTFHQKKGYYSKERESDIIVDISIECFLKDKNKYSQLIIIECKNYSKSIPVDDIEEFNSKLKQITGVNVKGMFFSKSSYQKGAYNVAKNTGMALIRMLPNSQIEWILERKPISSDKLERQKEDMIISARALSEYNYIGYSHNVFSYFNDTFTSSFTDTFNNLIFTNSSFERNLTGKRLSTYKSKSNSSLKYLGFDELENKTLSLIQQSHKNSDIIPIDFTKIISYMETLYDVKFIFSENLGIHNIKGEILGIMDIKNNTIKITNQLEKNSHRWRFTLAHEIGHYILHSNFITEKYDLYSEVESNFFWDENNLNIMNSIKNSLEWQANMFANCILMPRYEVFNVIKDLVKKLQISNFSNGIIYLDNQPCNIHNYNCVIEKLKRTFNVSATIATIRLKQLRILNDARIIEPKKLFSITNS
ncbi:ImmA/IrrE family metallo-endopeptidase [Xenorhabdus sp. DI]|uniref:ImmA/IrrE family metallo-endopeptidase n=1 Tax=Xenorhabdus doucetiae TaxID=351671 RepID=UPI0019C077F6|nr:MULTISPECIES: ImmA/IrrE family metallo-endopeptidase [unclassified Xenorhabdus]MBD2784202.1 ImmA/IrrE family metallo-endopeptidase [Xenorhabdus sp. 3]MBD2789377.1 ImmA/IrrE family metallo-endopeptidase [Xenorhabdus sp. DI]